MVDLMNKVLTRMLALKEEVSKYKEVRCLLGLGSLSNQDRLDDFSDIDFFLIVENGQKEKFINDLSWLEVEPLIYSFKNTRDGYKAMYHDGVFAEFAVFDEEEMKTAKFTGGKVFYHKEDFDLEIIKPKYEPKLKEVNVNFNINEALTNLYIGLLRDLRGEKSSAMTFIQSYAYGLTIELFPKVFDEEKNEIDPYVFERRIETRFPNQKALLMSMRQGINKNKESAKAILDFLNSNFSVNKIFREKLVSLINN